MCSSQIQKRGTYLSFSVQKIVHVMFSFLIGICAFPVRHFHWPFLQFWFLFNRAVTVVKKELMYAGTFGIAMALSGAIFVNRGSSEAGRKAVNEAGAKAKASGTSMFLFPEGTRHRSSGLLPFKKGAFHVALDCGLPILPLVVSEYNFLGPNRKDQFPGGDITIQVLPPIEIEGFSKETIDDLIKATREPMEIALKTISNKS